jgi:nucleotide-binding universal stress UspA family protein
LQQQTTVEIEPQSALSVSPIGSPIAAPFDPLASYVGEWKQEMSDSIRGLLKYESANFARYDIQIEQQSAVAGIADATSRYAPDLLVVGIRGGGRLRRMLARSVAKRILHDTNCDVLIVPEGSFGVSQSKLLIEGHRPRESAKTLETPAH